MESQDNTILVCAAKNSLYDYGKCIITTELDKMSGLNPADNYGFCHYLMFSDADLNDHLISIRVPGGTVGAIEFDKDYIITNVYVDTNYVIQSYWRHVNKHLKKYIGMKLELFYNT